VAGGEIIVKTENLHRYPDPHQEPVKKLFCSLRNSAASPAPISKPSKPLSPDNLFLGVGSDECIDALLRAFCEPAKDCIIVCPPTYGMYNVSAAVNDVNVVRVPLKIGDDSQGSFSVDVEAIRGAVAREGKKAKLVYLCSPGNPTAAVVDADAVLALLLDDSWNGVVVVDEAYIDFSTPGSSFAPWVVDFPNLVVMQTLSKSFGLAGIRLGASFTSPEIAAIFNSLKAPYSISTPTSEIAAVALSPAGLRARDGKVAAILQQRDWLVQELPQIDLIGRFRGGFDANFLLVEMRDRQGKPSNAVAQRVYTDLAEIQGVVVRFRGSEYGCEGCLRITVGTASENLLLVKKLKEVVEKI
jgi:histidinol-phosphate aminotransferase